MEAHRYSPYTWDFQGSGWLEKSKKVSLEEKIKSIQQRDHLESPTQL